MKNKKYFTKYLPTKENPKIDSIILVKDTSRLARISSWDNSMGFTFIEYLDDKEVDLTDEYEVVQLFLLLKTLKGKERVLGQISKEASWVKEGDEFTIKQLAFKMFSNSPTPFYQHFVDIKNFKPGIELCKKELWSIGVLCPTCETFH